MHLRTAFTILALLSCICSALPALSAGPAKPAVKKPAPANLTGAYNAYVNKLRNKVLNNWNLADGKNNVVLQATVGNDGAVSDIVLKSTPKNAKAEEAANAAFAQSQPLEPLPPGSALSARLTLNFQSTADPHGDTSSNLSARIDPVVPPKTQPAAAPATSAKE